MAHKQKKLKVGSIVLASLPSSPNSFSGVVSQIYEDGPFNISIEILANSPTNTTPYRVGQNYIFCESELEVLFS